MSVIEKAAKRLEELKRAGIEPPAHAAASADSLVDRSAASEKVLSSSRREPELRPVPAVQEATASTEWQPEAESRRAELNLARIAATGIVTPDAPRSRIADEFRVIKRPLLANASRKGASAIRNGNLIMITSALPTEGKSFTAVNLAMSIAMEMDRTVLLVDADVARPSIPEMLGLPPTQGLLDMLVNDSVDLSRVLVKSDVEKLTILSSGTAHPRATELLASDAMNRLLQDMAQRYSDRIIIFDSPPLLVTTEARVLAAHMGQVVLVVQANRTTHAAVKHALATVEMCPVKLMVLNKARDAVHDAYGYGYGYG